MRIVKRLGSRSALTCGQARGIDTVAPDLARRERRYGRRHMVVAQIVERRDTRTTEARDKRRGIPQGSPLSPLLANIYMRRFVLGWKKLGLEEALALALSPMLTTS